MEESFPDFELRPLGKVIKQAKVKKCGDGDYPVLSMTMHDGLVFQNEKFKKTIASADTSQYKVVNRNQLVISFPIDEGVLATQRIIDAGIVSPAYGIWDIDMNQVDPEFLEFSLRSERAIQYYKSKLRGSTARRRSLPTPTLLEFAIPIPSMKQQKAILEKIHLLQKLIEQRKAQLEQFDTLIKARFIEQFGDTNYPEIRLGDVCTKITDGTHKTPTYLSDGVTFISAKNIINGELDFSDVKHISEDEYMEIQKRCQTEIGDILMSKSGSLGAPVIVRTDMKIGLFESLAVIKYDRNKFVPEFLCEQLKSELIQRQFATGTKGVAIKHLHLGVIADTLVKVPSIEEQHQFASFVTEVDKSKVAIQKSLDELQTLFDSLMQEYFG